MMRMFEITDLGLLHYFLGIEIVQESSGIFICQRKYAIDLLKRFNMLNCKVVNTPMNVNEKLSLKDGTEKADRRYFRSLIGGLIYLTQTRPNLAFFRVLHYIAGTTRLWYTYNPNFQICGFIDNDWAGSVENRKSVSEKFFTLGSAAITWSSKQQSTIALSSFEAEYVAAASSACQALWLRKLLTDLYQT
ncbi:hypothetical protein K2173_018126 [Erythroxylum novogranatense]|uniref:Reverse transcriptase Ty1/copia-type domain-containing protein n=1 Tax=Erythroxylum novogranatense TaxID=1862640 RepID=A0AAV8U6B9_9ROSI|nr:hypothetical protein K2173_018126 [Erythroxylum novogranatense]